MVGAASYSLNDYPSPFVSDDGAIASQIVVGANAKTADVVGGINVALGLGAETIKTEKKTETVSAGGGSGWSASEGATVSTENTQLYFGQDLTTNGLQTTMTKDQLSVLESGTVEVDNTDHNYDQYVNLKTTLASSIGTSGGDLDDAQLMVNLGTSAGDAYTATVTFDKAVNMTKAAEDDAELTLFGKQYSVSADSDISNGGDKIVLFGGKETATVSENGETTVTIGDKEITLGVDSVTASNNANVLIDGDLEGDAAEDDTFSVSGIDEEVRIDNIIYRGDLEYGKRGKVIFSIGSEQLTLQDGQPVMTGSDEEEIDNTNVKINGGGASDAEVSKIEVETAAQDSDEDHLAAGEVYEDPVFGTFSLSFGGVNPAEEAESRSLIEAGVSGDDTGTLAVTDDAGNEATFNLATDGTPGTANGASDISIYSDDYSWDLVEGSQLAEDDRFVVNQGDFTHVLEVKDIEGHEDEDEVEFEDVFTGTSYVATLDGDGDDNIFIDGQEYYVSVDNSDNVAVTWGSGAGYGGDNDLGSKGSATTVYPYFQDENDAEIAFTTNDAYDVSISDGGGGDGDVEGTETLELPTGNVDVHGVSDGAGNIDEFTVEYSGSNTTVSAGGTDTVTVGQVEFFFEASSASDPNTLSVSLSDQASSELERPAALVVEEEDDNSDQNAVVLTYSDDSDGITVETPVFTDTESSGTLDNDDKIYMDLFGTYAVEDADDNEFVEVYYPDTQATVGLGVLGQDGKLTATGGGSATVEYTAFAGKGELSDMAMLDSQVTNSVKNNNNLLLMGGPYVNSLVEELAGPNSSVWTKSKWQETGKGTARLNMVNDAFVDGEVAMVVAGYSADDTRAAAKSLMNYDQAPFKDKVSEGTTEITIKEADYPS